LVDEASGRLELIGHRSTEGKTPRNFAISPDGRYLLAANQDSDSIVTMPIDPETGELGETVAVAEVPTPVCLEFGR
jgi:6-phosphogluconolactonase